MLFRQWLVDQENWRHERALWWIDTGIHEWLAGLLVLAAIVWAVPAFRRWVKRCKAAAQQRREAAIKEAERDRAYWDWVRRNI